MRKVAIFALLFGLLGSAASAILFSSYGSSSPSLSFTVLASSGTSSTTAGSGFYTVSAPTGLANATWGGGCSGSSTVSGFSAAAGAWSATFSTPASAGTNCNLTVTGTGANTAAASSPGVAIGGGAVAFTAVHKYFMAATGCSDGNDGLTTGTPWCTPTGHSLACGDVVIAAPGTYGGGGQWFWNNAVSGCPSTTGGIDGTGGVYFATILCGGTYVGACLFSNATTYAFNIATSNIAVEGWACTTPAGRCFQANATATGTTILHDIAFINDIAYNTLQGFTINDGGLNHNVPGNGVDYFFVVGSIAQNAANDTQCIAAVDFVGPANFDANTGTHALITQVFGIKNQQASGCGSDGEAFMIDTLDAHGYTGQVVIKNTIAYLSARPNYQLTYQAFNVSTPTVKLYNNTSFNCCAGSNIGVGSNMGEFNAQATGASWAWITSIYNNIGRTNNVHPGNLGGTGYTYAALTGGNYSSLTWGGSGTQNVFYGTAGTCAGSSCDSGDNVVAFNSGSFGTNTYEDALFANTADLLANQTGVPTCSSFPSVVACMGWNYLTQTASANTVIGDLTPTAGGTAGVGYQGPATGCQADADYPTRLKGIVYLRWDGTNLTENPGLVTKPCNL